MIRSIDDWYIPYHDGALWQYDSSMSVHHLGSPSRTWRCDMRPVALQLPASKSITHGSSRKLCPRALPLRTYKRNRPFNTPREDIATKYPVLIIPHVFGRYHSYSPTSPDGASQGAAPTCCSSHGDVQHQSVPETKHDGEKPQDAFHWSLSSVVTSHGYETLIKMSCCTRYHTPVTYILYMHHDSERCLPVILQ